MLMYHVWELLPCAIYEWITLVGRLNINILNIKPNIIKTKTIFLEDEINDFIKIYVSFWWTVKTLKVYFTNISTGINENYY